MKDTQLKHLAQQLYEHQSKEMTENRKRNDLEGKSISPQRRFAQGNQTNDTIGKKVNIDTKTLNQLFMGIIETAGIANNQRG